ncbi:MAG: penicillin-binding protein 1A [Pseudomonadota bacterium]
MKRFFVYLAWVVGGSCVVGAAVVGFMAMIAYTQLPSLSLVTNYQPKVPLRIFSIEGELIGEFGLERRQVVRIQDVPPLMKNAILAAEDARFYEHSGVDFVGVGRAVLANLRGHQQGAGTITMQVAREFFLTREKKISRKVNEILLAYRIEAALSKDQILELYINQIHLGQRSYGFSAAAQTYFGKSLKALTPADAAMLAGLPKAPSRDNPIANPKRAMVRRNYILQRMYQLHFITQDEYEAAVKEPAVPEHQVVDLNRHTEYVSEMVRQALFDNFGEAAYEKGYQVHTTIRKADQESAYNAVRRGVMEYDYRHGYRGPEHFFTLPSNLEEAESTIEKIFAGKVDEKNIVDHEDLRPAIVLSASASHVRAMLPDGQTLDLKGNALRFVRRALGSSAPGTIRLRRGALIRVINENDGWSISQMPNVEAALIALSPDDGSIRALVGGFDFSHNKFNHVTQAERQPGSSFKPFIYSAALEKGFGPSTIINDSPLSIDDGSNGVWEPKNYDGHYEGPMKMRTALMKSKNMVSIRILQSITPSYAQEYIKHFGFNPQKHPAYLTMALGAGTVTPLQMANAYAVFANQGHRVTPHLITKVLDQQGRVLWEPAYVQAGKNAPRAIDARNAFIMTDMLQDVVRAGTATKAMKLGRHDLAGKTGTTNESNDAWFCGYNASLVAIAWIGFDQPRSLGAKETGGAAALPIWINYMAKALKGIPEKERTVPEGVLEVGGDYYYNEFPPHSGGGGSSNDSLEEEDLTGGENSSEMFNSENNRSEPVDPDHDSESSAPPPAAPSAPTRSRNNGGGDHETLGF